MTRISWDGPVRLYTGGVSQGVLYPQNAPGVAWNGLISVTDKGDDNDPAALYIDGQKIGDRTIPSTFSGTISAYTYPDQFDAYIGYSAGVTSQPRQTFGMSYRTNSELHIVYNALTSPSSDEYDSLDDSVSATAFSWDFTTLPVDIYKGRPSAHLIILLDIASPGAISEIEDFLYGSEAIDPQLPDPADILEIFESNATLRITDNGDGTWTALGPDSAITMLDSITFQIDWPSIMIVDADSYKIYSQ